MGNPQPDQNRPDRIFERKLYSRLKDWKVRSGGSTALLIEGARRVGKSTLVETFAANEYAAYLIIDFSRTTDRVKALFDDLSDLDALFRGLQLFSGVDFVIRDTVIVFDEVERFPRAREAIKALVADGRYDYIETGSLISIKRNVKGIVIPSEEEKMMLHPMDFEEFLWARGNRTLALLKGDPASMKPLQEEVHQKLMKLFREYLAVGGMPQAVKAFLDGANYREIDAVKRRIIGLYIDDFRKIDESGKLGELFMSIPSELSRQTRRFRVTSVPKASRLDDESDSFFDMADSQTVEMSYHVSDPRVGMSMTIDHNFFKMYCEDTGLFVTLCFYDSDFSDNIIYDRLVEGRLPANLGYVYENAVAQALVSSGHRLRYHTFPKVDGTHYYEIDFLMADGTKVVPIEVKSSKTFQHKSLDVFMGPRGKDVSRAYVISPKNLRVDGKIVYLPIYMAGLIRSQAPRMSEADSLNPLYRDCCRHRGCPGRSSGAHIAVRNTLSHRS